MNKVRIPNPPYSIEWKFPNEKSGSCTVDSHIVEQDGIYIMWWNGYEMEPANLFNSNTPNFIPFRYITKFNKNDITLMDALNLFFLL